MKKGSMIKGSRVQFSEEKLRERLNLELLIIEPLNPSPMKKPKQTPPLPTDKPVWWKAEEENSLLLREDTASYGDHPKAYDLEERVAKFGEEAVRFAKRIPRHPANDRLIGQLVGADTSVGANYLEATEGVSAKDFRYPISRAKKEAKETKFFLRMIVASEGALAAPARVLYREAHELHLIFAAIHRNTKLEGKVQVLSPKPGRRSRIPQA